MARRLTKRIKSTRDLSELREVLEQYHGACRLTTALSRRIDALHGGREVWVQKCGTALLPRQLPTLPTPGKQWCLQALSTPYTPAP